MFLAYSLSMILVKDILIKIVLQRYYNEDIEMICTNGFKRCCYLILMSVIVDYKKQVLIIGIKVNMQCSIYLVPSQVQENLTKTWSLWTHEST